MWFLTLHVGSLKKMTYNNKNHTQKMVSLSLIFSVISYCIYILVSEIDIKYTFLVRFHIFHKTIDFSLTIVTSSDVQIWKIVTKIVVGVKVL
jgi:hypothetical protein